MEKQRLKYAEQPCMGIERIAEVARALDTPVMADESMGAHTAGKAAAAFGASGWPYLVIVGADGTVKARVSGEVEIADLQKIVDDALTS